MVIRKWKRIFPARKILEDFGSGGSISKEEISQFSTKFVKTLEFGVPSNV